MSVSQGTANAPADPAPRDPGCYGACPDCNVLPKTSKSSVDVPRIWGIIQSRHSRRTVPISRSQTAFASGLCGGDFRTLSPKLWMDSFRLLTKLDKLIHW